MFMFLEGTVGLIAVGLLAAALPWMVMAGMHTVLAPFMTQLLTNPGYDAMIHPAFLLHIPSLYRRSVVLYHAYTFYIYGDFW